MLEAIGVGSVEELFAEIPAARAARPPARAARRARRGRGLRAPARARGAQPQRRGRALLPGRRACTTTTCRRSSTCCSARSEFLTPYTPYQPEISQGGLQVMFEYQTAICELTGMDVSNASVYEGPSALAAAGYLAKLTNGRPRFVISRGVHPHARETLRTLSVGLRHRRSTRSALRDGVTDADGVGGGDRRRRRRRVRRAAELPRRGRGSRAADRARRARTERSSSAAPTRSRSGSSSRPGALGVDVCVGEGQTLGNRLDFGGPSFGFFAAREEHLRRMPGRIAGETRDVDGRRGFVLTLQTREQHIRREKATSNICTAQALNALAGVVYLSWLGRAGPGRARRAARAPHRLRARRAGRDRRRRAAARRSRWCASSRSRSACPTSRACAA